MPHPHSHPIMPVCKRAVAKPIPDPEDKPGEGRQKNNHEMNPSRFFPDPSEEIKNNQYGMKDKKEYIQKSIHHHQSKIRILILKEII